MGLPRLDKSASPDRLLLVMGYALVRAPLFAMLSFAAMLTAFDGSIDSLAWGSFLALGLSGIWISTFNERWLKWAEARARDPAAFDELAMRLRLPYRGVSRPTGIAI